VLACWTESTEQHGPREARERPQSGRSELPTNGLGIPSGPFRNVARRHALLSHCEPLRVDRRGLQRTGMDTRFGKDLARGERRTAEAAAAFAGTVIASVRRVGFSCSRATDVQRLEAGVRTVGWIDEALHRKDLGLSCAMASSESVAPAWGNGRMSCGAESPMPSSSW